LSPGIRFSLKLWENQKWPNRAEIWYNYRLDEYLGVPVQWQIDLEVLND